MKKLLVLVSVATLLLSACQKQSLTESGTSAAVMATTSSAIVTAVSNDVFTTSTYTGSSGQAGLLNGALTVARYDHAEGIAFDSKGNMIIADRNNHVIRMVDLNGVVSTIAGQAKIAGFADGAATVAKFDWPFSVAVDKNDNIYVADRNNHAIRKIAATTRVVSTVAGAAGPGDVDGTVAKAKFTRPVDVAISSDGSTIYVADQTNGKIRKIVAGNVSTLVSGLILPSGVAINKAGSIIVPDRGHHKLLEISPAGVSKVIAGNGDPGLVDGPALKGSMSEPYGVTVGPDGTTIYVTELGNHTIRMLSEGRLLTIAGSGKAGFSEGDFSSFNTPTDLAFDSNGNLFVADFENSVIRKLAPSGRLLRSTLNWKVKTLPSGLVWYKYAAPYLDKDSVADQSINVLDVDLSKYKLVFQVSPAKTTSERAAEVAGALAATNGTFGDYGSPSGNLASYVKYNGQIQATNGMLWQSNITMTEDAWWIHSAYLYIDANGVAGVKNSDMSQTVFSPVNYPNITSGAPMLIDERGPIGITSFPKPAGIYANICTIKVPRTAMAVTQNNHVLLITVDGLIDIDGAIRGTVRGLSTPDLTQFLQTYFKPKYAMGLDGGGSTTMWIPGEGDRGIVNSPSWHRPSQPPSDTDFGRQRLTLKSAIVVVKK